MFRASSAHLQEVKDVNCTCMQPLVFSFSAGGRLVHLLRGDLGSLMHLLKGGLGESCALAKGGTWGVLCTC